MQGVKRGINTLNHFDEKVMVFDESHCALWPRCQQSGKNGGMDERTEGRDGRKQNMDGRVGWHERMDGRIGRMDGRDGRMDGREDRMDGGAWRSNVAE